VSADLLREARAEEHRLEASIRADTERLEAVRRVIALYEGDALDAASVVSAPLQPTNGDGQAAQIRTLAAAYLRQKGGRASAGEIYRHLVAKGVRINALRPTSVVSSRLSRSPMFDNIATEGGYGLVG
jgi:hypothetical protein